MEFDFLRAFTWIIWFAALIAFYIQVKEHPKVYQKERILYSFAIVSYIVHVLIFYAVIYFQNPDPGTAGVTTLFYASWSNVLRIHGGFAILFKEIVAIIRLRLFNKKGNTDE